MISSDDGGGGISNSASLSRVSKLASTLFNYLLITKLRPNAAHNRTYFDLIEKLNSIKAYLEPWSSNKLAASSSSSSSSHMSSLLDVHIDAFRENVDKNLSTYFARVHLLTFTQGGRVGGGGGSTSGVGGGAQQKMPTSLNSHINQLELIRRLVSSGPVMRRKLCLGHLITRNFLQILLNSLARLNDYLAFYFYLKSTNQPVTANFRSFEQLVGPAPLDNLLSLLEPVLFLVKVIVLNLARPDRLILTSGLPTLFRLYSMFNQLIVGPTGDGGGGASSSTSSKRMTTTLTLKKIYAEKLRDALHTSVSSRVQLVSVHMQRIFAAAAFTVDEPPSIGLFNELARFCLDAPIFLVHGLGLFEQLLKSSSLLSSSFRSSFFSQLNVCTTFSNY